MRAYAGRHFVPFLWWSLVWPSRDANPRPTVWESDTLTTKLTQHSLLRFNMALTSEVISQQCLLVAIVFWPICSHTLMSFHRHRTWHPTLSQFTDTGPIYYCAIHWCELSHCNTQLTILMSLVWLDWDILPWPYTHAANTQLCDAVVGSIS